MTKNAHRQETFWTSHPPSTGPAAAVIDVNPDQVPIARPRSLSGNEALMSARLPGTRSAPPIPWTARATMSCVTFGASPHHADASPKTTTPAAKTIRRL